jgi:signal transduction histidine kinase/DNA-binding response OmpR family regulator
LDANKARRIFVNNQKTIVIVEDEIIIAEDLKITLRNLDYKVIGPYSEGQSLIDEIDSLSPDLILMDIMLNGDLSGIETAEIIQQKHDIPIIYVTAYANSKILQQVKKTNPFGYIVKPFEERELHATIELAFSRSAIEKEKERQTRYQKSLLKSSKILNNNLDFHSVCSSIITEAKYLLQSKFAGLYIYNEMQNGFSLFDLNNDLDKKIKERAEIIMKDTINNEKSIVHTDKDKSEYIVSIPLIKDKLIQAVIVTERDTSPFDESELTLLNTFASHASIVLHNAQTHEELNQEIEIRKQAQAEVKQQLENEQTISEISSQFVVGSDLKDSVRFTLRKIRKNVGADQTYLIKLKNETKSLQPEFQYFSTEAADKNISLADLKMEQLNSWIIQTKLAENIEISAQTELAADDRSMLEYFSAQHLLAFPFTIKNEIDGFLVVCYKAKEINWNDKNRNLLVLASDIVGNALEKNQIETEKLSIQEQLFQSQKMEVVGKLAGGIAHDFNNLLTAINGYSELGLKKVDSADPVAEDLEVIYDCGQKAAQLTQKLLGFSRKQIAIPIVVNLNELIGDLKKMLDRLLPAKMKLVQNFSEQNCLIKADPGQIEQIIVNLIVNARDAMQNEGEIKVTTQTIHLATEKQIFQDVITAGDYVTMSVQDLGSGIDPQILPHIFEPFFTTKKVNEGTGLGLSTLYGILQQNNGHIDVSSEPGKGSTFTIYLPSAGQENQKSPESYQQEDDDFMPEGSETILFIEDEDNIRDFVSTILEDLGYQVISGADGEDGWQKAEANNFDFSLLLADVRMPKISGPSLAKKILQHNPKLKTLFISGFDNEELKDEELEQLSYLFLQKPFTVIALAQKVREALDNLK